MTELDDFMQPKKHKVIPTQREISQLAIEVVKQGKMLELPQDYG
jgi:hypothetical protein